MNWLKRIFGVKDSRTDMEIYFHNALKKEGTRRLRKENHTLSDTYSKIPFENVISMDHHSIYFYSPLIQKVYKVWVANLPYAVASDLEIIEVPRHRLRELFIPGASLGSRLYNFRTVKHYFGDMPGDHWCGCVLKARDDYVRNQGLTDLNELLSNTDHWPYIRVDDKFYKTVEITKDEWETGVALEILKR